MKQIILMRHGISEGNEKNIVQGQLNYHLSTKGVQELSKLDIKKLEKINDIYSSDLFRAVETAKIIKERTNFAGKINTTEILRENSAGILEGMTKEKINEEYPEYYKIYLARGDYDLIPGADSWYYNQSRALAFLQKYIGKEDYNDLIVSHGAFIRNFYNLCLGRERNTKIDSIYNCSINVIQNPLNKLAISKIEIAKTSEVFNICTYDNEYILKRYNRKLNTNDMKEINLLRYLHSFNLSPYYYYVTELNEKAVKVMEYCSGEHRIGQLTKKEIDLLINKFNILKEKLKEYKDASNFEDGNIIDDLNKTRRNLYSEEYKKRTLSLLQNEKFINYIRNGEKSLVHNDLHRYNILFNKNNITFLDFDNIKKYPSLLQLATFICSCFILEKNSYEYVLNMVNEKIDKEILDCLIEYRLLYGLGFFENNIKTNNYNMDDIKLRKKYIGGLNR